MLSKITMDLVTKWLTWEHVQVFEGRLVVVGNGGGPICPSFVTPLKFCEVHPTLRTAGDETVESAGNATCALGFDTSCWRALGS